MNQETREMIISASRPVRIAVTVALSILALFLLVKTFDGMARFGQGDNPQVNTITVTGTGTSSATPDIAKISFTVQESAKTVKEAQDAAAKKTNDAIAAMKTFDIAEKDVKTSNYNVSPQYAQAPQPCYGAVCTRVMMPTTASNTIVGYEVSESIEVTVRDTSKAGDVLSKLGALGVQNISGPNFTFDDDNGVMNDARAAAIANARDKAKELAKELGVSLGSVVNYSDQGGYPTPMYEKAMMSDAGATAAVTPNLPVGSEERTVNVQVTYQIK